MPERIQLSRRKGWRKPADAVVVSRPSGWGNPFRAGHTKFLIAQDGHRIVCTPGDVSEAVAYFRWFITHDPERVARVRTELAGKDLCCWCALDQPCHADVLLELANGDPDA